MNEEIVAPNVEELEQARAIREQAITTAKTEGRALIGKLVNASLAKYLVPSLKNGTRDYLAVSVYLNNVPEWDTGMVLTVDNDEDLATIRNTVKLLGGIENYIDTVDDLYKPYVVAVGMDARPAYVSVLIVLA